VTYSLPTQDGAVLTKPAPRTVAQTCDRCGPSTRASMLYELEALVLSFCGHHVVMFDRALKAGGWTALPLSPK